MPGFNPVGTCSLVKSPGPTVSYVGVGVVGVTGVLGTTIGNIGVTGVGVQAFGLYGSTTSVGVTTGGVSTTGAGVVTGVSVVVVVVGATYGVSVEGVLVTVPFV